MSAARLIDEEGKFWITPFRKFWAERRLKTNWLTNWNFIMPKKEWNGIGLSITSLRKDMSHCRVSELEKEDELEEREERGFLFIFFGLNNWERRDLNSLWRPLRWRHVEQDSEADTVSVVPAVLRTFESLVRLGCFFSKVITSAESRRFAVRDSSNISVSSETRAFNLSIWFGLMKVTFVSLTRPAKPYQMIPKSDVFSWVLEWDCHKIRRI